MFCFFVANFMSSTYADNDFLRTILPKDDHTDFVQQERLGLPYWTMIQTICVVVDESTSLDIPILEFEMICDTWVQADTASAACPAQAGNLEITPMIFAAVI